LIKKAVIISKAKTWKETMSTEEFDMEFWENISYRENLQAGEAVTKVLRQKRRAHTKGV